MGLKIIIKLLIIFCGKTKIPPYYVKRYFYFDFCNKNLSFCSQACISLFKFIKQINKIGQT